MGPTGRYTYGEEVKAGYTKNVCLCCQFELKFHDNDGIHVCFRMKVMACVCNDIIALY